LIILLLILERKQKEFVLKLLGKKYRKVQKESLETETIGRLCWCWIPTEFKHITK